MNWNEFIANVDDLVRKGSRFEVQDIVPLLEQLLKESNLVGRRFLLLPPGLSSNDSLVHLAQDESWSVEVFIWKKGVRTPIHDHLTWGVIGQYIGQELEIKYKTAIGDRNRGPVRLIETGRTYLNPGDVTTLIPPDDIHQVRNVFSGTSVSIHVYGTNMKKQLRHEFNYETGLVTVDRRR